MVSSDNDKAGEIPGAVEHNELKADSAPVRYMTTDRRVNLTKLAVFT